MSKYPHKELRGLERLGQKLAGGPETYAKEIKGITFEDCKLIHMTAMAMAIWLVDNAHISDVTFRNITVENDSCLLKMCGQKSDSQVYCDHYDPYYGGFLVNFAISQHFEYSMIKTREELGKVSGVTLENINYYATQKPSFSFVGANPNSPCENITLKDIFWNGERVSADLFRRRCYANEFANVITLIET